MSQSWNGYAEGLGLDHRVLGPRWRTFWSVPSTEKLLLRLSFEYSYVTEGANKLSYCSLFMMSEEDDGIVIVG